MNLNDLFSVFQWWSVLFFIGFLFLPLTKRLFSSFFDNGYIFSKVIGSLIISYIFYVLGTIHVISFNKTNPITLYFFLLLLYIFLIFLFLEKGKFNTIINIYSNKFFIFLSEEIIFFLALLYWSYIRSFQPDILGLEKFMDFGFVNSILRSEYFPPKDIWFPPFPINYYYFGHLVTAVLTKLSNLPSFMTYNLMIATLFAYTFSLSFSIGANLISFIYEERSTSGLWIVLGGLLSAGLVSLAGNIHTIYSFFKPYDTSNPTFFTNLVFSPSTFPNSYWYPNATRFIYNTIHEFPIYSFVVSDLHGHVLSIPIVLTIIAILLHIFLFKGSNIWKILFISFLLSCAYMTNAWDGVIYGLFAVLVLSFLNFKKITSNKLFFIIFTLGFGFILFSLPFSIFFKPFASGIGLLCAPQFLINMKSLGPLLFEENHCQKSSFWQLFILYGFFYFWVVMFVGFLKKNKKYSAVDTFITILIVLSTVLIIIPEFVYLKDIYPAHYRANTMFKLVYQSFIMLSLSSGYIIIRLISNLKSQITNFLIWIIGFICLFLGFLYPYFAVNSYYGNLLSHKSLDGISYLKTKNFSDYQTIQWFNNTIKGQPVILEAQGDSYTDYERISSYTGLPTVLGWTVHEWLWRKTYDVPAPRISDVKNIYESNDINLTKNLLKKYNVEFIVIGDLERQKYSHINEDKFDQTSTVVFRSEKTKVYKLL